MRALQKNGYALTPDLEDPEVRQSHNDMELAQLEFFAAARDTWDSNFPFAPDALGNWSRQWEYPYGFANLGVPPGRVLDAGSGFTFFPFYLARKGFEVHCCDIMPAVAAAFQNTSTRLNPGVRFKPDSITALTYPEQFFNAVSCISVLEHMPQNDRKTAIRVFSRVLQPGGRLIITCDIGLEGEVDIRVDRFAQLPEELRERFVPDYALDFRRSPDLLITDNFRATPWRLSWRARPSTWIYRVTWRAGHRAFHSVAVVGLTLSNTHA